MNIQDIQDALRQLVADDPETYAPKPETAGILVGVIHETRYGAKTTMWKHVHSMMRCKDGSMVLYGLDDQRTPEVIPARLFAGVCGV